MAEKNKTKDTASIIKKEKIPKRTIIVVHVGWTDLRKGVYALRKYCFEEHKAKVGRPRFFVFCNWNKTKIRIIVMCRKIHMIQDNGEGLYQDRIPFDWWPDTDAELKKSRKLIRKNIIDIIKAYGYADIK